MEIRREFLDEAHLRNELRELEIAAKKQHITLFYSVNDEIFKENKLNPKLTEYVEEALLLGSERIKFNFGSYSNEFTSELAKYLKQLEAWPLKINNENNQTEEHCDLQSIIVFFDFCQTHDIKFNFCFDLANWLCTRTSIEEAISSLASYTDYVHLKNYKYKDGELVVTSLERGQLHWQTLLTQFKANIELTLEYNGTKDMIKEDLSLLRANEK